MSLSVILRPVSHEAKNCPRYHRVVRRDRPTIYFTSPVRDELFYSEWPSHQTTRAISSIGSRKMRSWNQTLNRILINRVGLLFRCASGFYGFTFLRISGIPTTAGIEYFPRRVAIDIVIFKLEISRVLLSVH